MTASAPARADHTAAPPPHHTRRPPRPHRFPSWAAKLVLSLTGLVFVAFVLVHMFGNLKIFTGAEHFDSYAHWLRTVGVPLVPREGVLWALRVVLLACLVAHVGCVMVLVARARAAAGSRRRVRLTQLSVGARGMLLSGVILLGFVVVHILDLTLGARPVGPEQFESGSAYANLVASFRRPAMAVFYVVAMLALAAHVAHGLLLAVQDLGGTGRRLRLTATVLGYACALALLLGNASIPVLVLAGVIA